MILTKRNYLGEGYVHKFYNSKTGEYKYIPITADDYHKLSIDTSHNPTKDGDWEWNCSIGGTLKVDTEDTMLAEGEYTIKDDEYWVRRKVGAILGTSKMTKQAFELEYPQNKE